MCTYRILKLSWMLAAFATLCACVWNSSVKELPDDLFSLSITASPARGGESAARERAAAAAKKHCVGRHQELAVVEVTTRDAWPKNSVATVTFKCE